MSNMADKRHPCDRDSERLFCKKGGSIINCGIDSGVGDCIRNGSLSTDDLERIRNSAHYQRAMEIKNEQKLKEDKVGDGYNFNCGIDSGVGDPNCTRNGGLSTDDIERIRNSARDQRAMEIKNEQKLKEDKAGDGYNFNCGIDSGVGDPNCTRSGGLSNRNKQKLKEDKVGDGDHAATLKKEEVID